MEDWAEIRRLYRAENLGIKTIARTLGVSRNTVRAAVASEGQPKYQRRPSGSAVDAFEDAIREQLRAVPTMPATVIAQRVGWTRGITVFKARVAVPRISIEPGRAIAGPSAFTLYEVGTVKEVALDGGARRAYVSVDGGMSDNVRTALYGADYSVTLASRASEAPPMISRVVGKHCESGDVVVMDEYLPADVRPGDLIAVPGTGAYCRALSSQYNHVPRPPVIAVLRDGAGQGQARVIVRRESIEDILALDIDG